MDEYCLPYIIIGATKLKAVYQFIYLGGAITSDAGIDKKID